MYPGIKAMVSEYILAVRVYGIPEGPLRSKESFWFSMNIRNMKESKFSKFGNTFTRTPAVVSIEKKIQQIASR